MRALYFIAACSFVVAACANAAVIEEDDSGPAADAGKSDATKTCPGAQKLCGTGTGTCTDTAKDVANCGACGNKCKAGQFCAAGMCSDGCMMPNSLCGQFCVDLNTDHENCGKCGMGCAADQECKGKACLKICPKGLTVCDPDCVDVVSDPNNCGACANACSMSQFCTGGLCCEAGQIACNGQCVSLQNDPNNCGACGFACGGNTPYCINSQCTNQTGGFVRDVNGNTLPVVFVPCGNGQNSNCTETVAEQSCINLGKKLVSHASDGTNGVVSLGATTSCNWSISYFWNLNPAVAGQCLVGVSNAKWTQCCGTSSWHGNTVTVPAQLNVQFGYVLNGNSGYNAMLTNTSGTTWGCNGNGTPPTPRNGCTTYYVACK
jgi:hypothetical protein